MLGAGIIEKARKEAAKASFSFIPEIDRMALEAKTPAELQADMLKKAADIMDAQADFIQTLIDRCNAATITHEELAKRLTAGLQTCRTSSRCMRSVS